MCLPGRWNGCERGMSRFMHGITHLDEYKGFKNTLIVCAFQLDCVFVKRTGYACLHQPAIPRLGLHSQEETFIPCWFLTSVPADSRVAGTLRLVQVLSYFRFPCLQSVRSRRQTPVFLNTRTSIHHHRISPRRVHVLSACESFRSSKFTISTLRHRWTTNKDP